MAHLAENSLWMAHKNYDSSMHALQVYSLVGGAIHHPHHLGKHLIRVHPSGAGFWSSIANLGKKIFVHLKPHIATVGKQLLDQGHKLASAQLAKLNEPAPEQQPTGGLVLKQKRIKTRKQ